MEESRLSGARTAGRGRKLYARVHRLLLGSDPVDYPPVFLPAMWALAALARLPSLAYGLDEDSIWCLITKIDQPWPVTLGFRDPYTLNHILNSSLSRILIKATGHHAVEATYRMPSLAFGISLMPLAFAVFARLGGRTCGMIASMACSCLPALALYGTGARGYASLVCLAVWALGLAPGTAGRLMPVRLGTAYFLLATSHGLGIVAALCLAAAGGFTGTERPRLRTLAANAALAVPGVLFNLPMAFNMRGERAKMALASDPGWVARTRFLPEWFGFQFGSGLFPGIGAVCAALMAWGFIIQLRRNRMAAAAMLLLCAAVPASFYLGSTYWTRTWYSMGCLGFWLWPLALGLADLHARASRAARFPWVGGERPGRFAVPVGLALMGTAWLPRTVAYLSHPAQDYLGAFRAVRQRCPGQASITAFTEAGVTGMGYYARRSGMGFHWARLSEAPDARASLALDSDRCFLSMGEPIAPELRRALGSHPGDALLPFNGIDQPLLAHVPAAPFPPKD